jgi:hypothetical protein
MTVRDYSTYPEIHRLLDIPIDEPIFILRAQDVASVPTLLDYITNRLRIDSLDDESESELHDIRAEFASWQGNNSHLVKIPS